MAPVGEPQVVDITSVWYLSIKKSRLARSINRNVMLLQQLLPAIHQISSEFFIFQQDSAPPHRALEAINFSRNFAKCWAILKILPDQLSSNSVIKTSAFAHIPPYGAQFRLPTEPRRKIFPQVRFVYRLLGEPPLGQSSPKWEKLIPDSIVEQASEVSRRYLFRRWEIRNRTNKHTKVNDISQPYYHMVG